MSLVIEDVLVRTDPSGDRLPVVFDSPHSGRCYPTDFVHACPASLLRQAEDAHVEDLFAQAPAYGATLLYALFPRSVIDVNRAIDDIDPEILDGPWPGPLHPTEKSSFGMGLVRTLVRPGVPIYDGQLSVADLGHRIETYYRPYHNQLRSVLDDLAASFGWVWHLNCHSMPATRGGPAGRGAELADIVLGDRSGTTCEPGFVTHVRRVLEGLGYSVAINSPYRGVELIRRYSNPARGRYSLQIEINRRLYLDETTLERHSGFEQLRHNLTHLIERICDYAAARLTSQAAE